MIIFAEESIIAIALLSIICPLIFRKYADFILYGASVYFGFVSIIPLLYTNSISEQHEIMIALAAGYMVIISIIKVIHKQLSKKDEDYRPINLIIVFLCYCAQFILN